MGVYKELVKSFLPEGILACFELTGLENQGEHLRLYLLEKDSIPEVYKEYPHRSNGFIEEIKVKDFPIRELFVTLHTTQKMAFISKCTTPYAYEHLEVLEISNSSFLY